MYITDLVKIKLINYGYLPNIPYHLISNQEMCDAFIVCPTTRSDDVGTGMFFDYYPLLETHNVEVIWSYQNFFLTLWYHVFMMRTDASYTAPDWVYSYMLDAVISVNSPKKDIHDLILPLGVDNIDDDFNAECSVACWQESLYWIRKSQLSESVQLPAAIQTAAFSGRYIYGRALQDLYDANQYSASVYGAIATRPPALFGEGHVIKSLRLKDTLM